MSKITGLLLAAALGLALTACNGTAPETGNAGTNSTETSNTETSNTETSSISQTTLAESQEAAKPSYETVKLRAAYMPNMGGASLLVTAKEFGFFDKYGLNVDLVEFGDGPAEIAAMASGDIDFAMIGHGAHALCAEGSAVVFYPDAIGLSSAVVANKNRGISTIEDLRGKAVAFVAGTSSEELLKLALSKADMTMDDIEAINFDVSGLVTAMASGQVDAAAASQPYTSTIAAQLGDEFLELCGDRDFLEERALMNSEICTADYAEKNPEILERITCALLEAADYRSAHIEEVARAVAKQCQGDEAMFLTLMEECMWLSGKEVNDYLKADALMGFYESAQVAFVNSGRLKASVPVENYVLTDIMKEACNTLYEN